MTYPVIAYPDDLEIFRKRITAEKVSRKQILLCMTGCRALGAEEVGKAFHEKLRMAGLEEEFEIIETGCHGQCSRAPVLLIEPEHFLYGGVSPDDVDEIIEKTLKGGLPVARLCADADGNTTADPDELPFFQHQSKEVLKNCGRVDPRKLESAVAAGAYQAAARALTKMSPEEIIDEVLNSGLRGRGGAGFLTGQKWRFCRRAEGEQKYLICNADEGDPGAFMDRALLEGNPHQIIEGMIIAAFAIGASRGFIYVRAEYPIAVEHITIASEQARACGLLGKNIFGSGFSFDIEIRMGAGAFVCGEETALIASLEGERGMPSPRPPFPAVKGFKGMPTNINNVETLANVPLIIEKGKTWFSAIGTPDGRGTKIFALAGKVINTGLVEVPLGATLRRIVFDIGGGIPGGRTFKAAQIGGPSGGCIPDEFLDLPLDYESVKELGAIIGSGGLIVMDDRTCMVDMARFFLDFVQKESCGKCVPCRVGTQHMVNLLTDICSGRGRPGDIKKLEDLSGVVKKGSLCGLGQTAPNPVLTTIRYFRKEYEAHINDGRCPAGVCKNLIEYSIIAEACRACGKCIKVCSVDAIRGEKKTPHIINPALCIRCGECMDVCPFDAVAVK
ncbi:MAG: NADH-quinone oxidoreductase subunit NuoF [Spirochaetales bacterium]|nr:NADH-quinone oxidoreductase subunit NuoF [Spirochaetales bacterium]